MWLAFRYALDEAVTSLWRGRRSGLLSTGTIALALFVLGGFLLATTNLQRLGAEWSRSAEMSVYLSDEITAQERTDVERMLAPGPLIAGSTFISKGDALKRFKETFADVGGTTDSLDENPLPASYEVRLRAADSGAQAVEGLAARLRGAAGVSDVRYDRQWLDRLLSAVALVRTVGLVLGGVLTLAAALTVANVVRLALYARRDELEIMQLVGAPEAYIRGPFVVEGILQGGIGAATALVGLGILFVSLRGRYLAPLAAATDLSAVHFLSPGLCLLILGGGMAVGCLGGLTAGSGRT